eukprot:TRINITY_DN15213_c0_g1_i1.p2 TRINITY_DN15213_c0_g1~~TRINITY_DN15213_c0_g1_i1.p2  ORF type:complete len:121 (+),score=18.52 TRINITY_DN15213_c0_g1_i1:51-365(+)
MSTENIPQISNLLLNLPKDIAYQIPNDIVDKSKYTCSSIAEVVICKDFTDDFTCERFGEFLANAPDHYIRYSSCEKNSLLHCAVLSYADWLECLSYRFGARQKG